MYAKLTLEAIDYTQELELTPEQLQAELTIWAQNVCMEVNGSMSTSVSEFFLGNYLKGIGITDISKTSTVGLVDTYTITYTDGTTTTFDVTNGSVGADGRGIVSILKTSTQELTDTYTITYTDGTTSTFDVTNGLDGISIESITLYETVGLVDTYEIVYSSGSRSYFNVTNGKDGIGTDGRGIVSIIKTSTVGLVDTYTITYSDSTTSTFYITNGKSAYDIYIAGGGTLSEVEFNTSITNIPSHIADDSIHHTFDEIRDNLGINEETGSEAKFLNEKGEMSEIVIGSGGYSAHVYATTINSDIAGYKKSSYTAETSETVISTTVSNSTVLVEEYIFDAPLGITQIPNGSWLFHYYAKIGATNPQGAKLRFAVYTRGTTGDETLLFTKDTPTFTNTDYIQVLPVEFIGNIYTCLTTDRIVFKVYAVTTSVPNVTVSYIVGDGRGLYVDSPIQLRHSQIREKNEELTYQHVDSTTELGEAINESTHSLLLWNGLKALKVTFARMKAWLNGLYLKLDQSTPQTITGNLTNSGGDYKTSANEIRLIQGLNVVFRGVRASSAWSDSVSAQWFQVGNSIDNVVFAALNGTPSNRTLMLTSAFQINNTIGGNAPIGIFDISRGNNKLFNVLLTGELGVGTTTPKSKLQVAGGIQCGDDTAAASADKLGTRRRRTGVNGNIGFYVSEECAKTDVNTYAWVEVFRNEWIIP